MSLFFNSDIQKLYLGSYEIKEMWMGGTQVWPAGLPVGTTFDFDYTGTVQSVELPRGKYKLQCWGAQGGNVTGTYAVNGSKGGYSEGVLTLTKTTTLYIFVGGQGTSYTSSTTQTSTSVVNGGWNGGGAGRRTSLYNSSGIDGRSFPRGGGGGTDISTVTSALSYSSGRTTRDSASLLARCIVAGGGAGASARYTVENKTVIDTSESLITALDVYWNNSVQTNLAIGNSGVALFNAIKDKTKLIIKGYINDPYTKISFQLYHRTEDSEIVYDLSLPISLDTAFSISYFGEATTAIISYYDNNNTGNVTGDCELTLYEVIENSTTTTETSSSKSNTTMQGGGTSGRGQYPGKATSAGSNGAFGLGASQSKTNYRYCSGGGGGGWYGGGSNYSDSSTSYINYTGGGSGFVNTSANASSRPSGYTGLQLDSGTTTAGNSSFPSTNGSTETGHSGNGYARITVIE